MRSRRDVTGMMVRKGNHPQMAASFSYFQVSELSSYHNIYGSYHYIYIYCIYIKYHIVTLELRTVVIILFILSLMFKQRGLTGYFPNKISQGS